MSWDIGGFGEVVKKDGSYTVLVVGAGSGIGKASAEFLAAQGATVICADRDKAAAEAVAKGDRRQGQCPRTRHHRRCRREEGDWRQRRRRPGIFMPW